MVLSAGMLLAVFTGNVQSAQSLTSLMYLPLIIPILFLMMTDINALPTGVQVALYIISPIHIFLGVEATLAEEWIKYLLSISYIIIFTMILLLAMKFLFRAIVNHEASTFAKET